MTDLREFVEPEARWALMDTFPFHRHFAVPWSSQAFAVNLFAPLARSDIASLLSTVFDDVTEAEDPLFEWSDPEDRLHESSGPRPHRTQVDVLLRGCQDDGRRVAVLIEVKYTERDFSGCSAVDAAPLDSIGPCNHGGPFGGDPQRCYQLRNWDHGHRRVYNEVLPAPNTVDLVGCSYRDGLNQVMRLVALGRVLELTGEFDDWRVALCAPSSNRPVQRTWERATTAFGNRLATIDPEHILACHPRSTRFALGAHYFMGSGEVAEDPRDDPPLPLGWKVARGIQLAAELLTRRPDLNVWLERYPAGGDVIALEASADTNVRVVLGGGIHLSAPGLALRTGLWWELAAERHDHVLDVLDRHLVASERPTETEASTTLTVALSAAAQYAHIAAALGHVVQVGSLETDTRQTTLRIDELLIAAAAEGVTVTIPDRTVVSLGAGPEGWCAVLSAAQTHRS